MLDAGCGPGHVAAYLRDRGAHVLGSDLFACDVRAARPRILSSLVRQGDLASLPSDASIGAIVCFYAVIHLDAVQRRAASARWRARLRPGGHLLLAFHTGDADTARGGSRRLREW